MQEIVAENKEFVPKKQRILLPFILLKIPVAFSWNRTQAF